MVPIAHGSLADMPKSTLIFQFGSFFVLPGICTCQPRLQTSHRPDGKNADALASTLALHNWECFGQLQYVRAAETFKSSHRPDGKIADVLALTHACTTANASVNYSRYVRQRPEKFPSPPWENG